MTIEQLILDLQILSMQKYSGQVDPEFLHLDEVCRILTEILDMNSKGQIADYNDAAYLMRELRLKAIENKSIDLSLAAETIGQSEDGLPLPENQLHLLGIFVSGE